MAPKKQAEPNEIMVVNDSPGEECRIAILQDGHLEELFTEREIVETILTIGFYQMLARLTECTDTELDEPSGTRVVDSLKPSK